MILLKLRNGWPDRIVSRNHEGPEPEGHVAFNTMEDLAHWKRWHPEMNPHRPSLARPRPVVWTKAEFKARVDKVAPNAWELWRQMRTEGNQTAITVWEDGWLTYSEIESTHPKTVEFIGAFVLIGILTESEAHQILNNP